jgi:hypothetical protein
MRIDRLCAAAQKRLAERRLDEVMEEQELFRFRVSATVRLWGFIKGSVFHVLWWDANHKVYPTGP